MKPVGIHEIAQLAKVSIGTVDRAMHGRSGISEATRDKVLRIAKKHGYSPNPAARSLAVRRSQFRIGVCIPDEIRFFYDQMRSGIAEEARRARSLGVEFIYRPVPSLGEKEQRELKGLLREELNGLIVVPGNPRVVRRLIDEAEKKGVRVICVSSDSPGSRRSTVVCVKPELNGRLAAELLAKFTPDRKQFAVITGMLKTEDHRQKSAGFAEGLADYAPGHEIVAVVEAHESERESFEKTRDLLKRNKDLGGIYVSTVNCLPVCWAIREHKQRPHLVTTDLFHEMVPYFEQGIIDASIYQDPYSQGRNAVRILVDHLVDKMPIARENFLNPGIVLRTNLRRFRETSFLETY